jgi:iron complex transport system ATP-binding protein
MMDATVNVLSAKHVSVLSGDKLLLDGVSVVARAGQLTAIAGPNGAGKSTLLRVLAGDVEPASGSVTLGGRELRDFGARELALRRAVLPQQTLLTFAFSVEEVVMMGRHPHHGLPGGDHAGNRRAVEQAMSITETDALAGRAFPSLSGGEQARVTLARVLAQETPAVLLDEPTAALDIRHQHLVLGIASDLARAGAAVVIVLHDLNLAAVYADQLILLDRGSLSAAGHPRDVLTAERLRSVFACPVAVVGHPVHDCPLVIPLGGAVAAVSTTEIL